MLKTLEDIIKKIKRQIRTIQRSDESTRKRWVVGSSAIAMIFIIILWIGYLKLSLPIAYEAEKKEEVASEESILTVLSRGVRIIASDLITQLENLVYNTKEFFFRSNEYSFEGLDRSEIFAP